MNLLCIDTSTSVLSVAVSKNERILRFRNTKLGRPLDRSIMPSIQSVLSGTGMTVGELDGFAVGLGPGSFTSLRVGLSTIKGMVFALRKPVIGVSSLDLLAMNVRGSAQVCALVDARRNLVYACHYEKKGSALIRKSDYLLTDIHNVLKQIKGEIVFIGDGLKLYKEGIERAKGITPRFVAEKNSFPQAKYLVPLVLERFRNKKWDQVDQLVPLYLYPDHCQIKNSKK
ncbi:MAG: tRNA (adenosine(37)-N6)-threonylcarbamoyltransferase complex dimerization subunit type 1 TsaB [Candidatus Omnitrophica bacterium]|nr:tRNA (adenosine(37)-N6)-threonylcarbamoyltransferase complex dimerization subunit type 1 TsaB [Candidatus Omnitrophota bacterium]